MSPDQRNHSARRAGRLARRLGAVAGGALVLMTASAPLAAAQDNGEPLPDIGSYLDVEIEDPSVQPAPSRDAAAEEELGTMVEAALTAESLDITYATDGRSWTSSGTPVDAIALRTTGLEAGADCELLHGAVERLLLGDDSVQKVVSPLFTENVTAFTVPESSTAPTIAAASSCPTVTFFFLGADRRAMANVVGPVVDGAATDLVMDETFPAEIRGSIVDEVSDKLAEFDQTTLISVGGGVALLGIIVIIGLLSRGGGASRSTSTPRPAPQPAEASEPKKSRLGRKSKDAAPAAPAVNGESTDWGAAVMWQDRVFSSLGNSESDAVARVASQVQQEFGTTQGMPNISTYTNVKNEGDVTRQHLATVR